MPGLFSAAMPADRADELAMTMSAIRPAGTRTMAYGLAEADPRHALPGSPCRRSWCTATLTRARR